MRYHGEMEEARWRHFSEVIGWVYGPDNQFAEDFDSRHYFTIAGSKNSNLYYFGPFLRKEDAAEEYKKLTDPLLPDWRRREIDADMVNQTGAQEGHYNWQCECCGDVWASEAGVTYDRTKDRSGWPVLCDGCACVER